VTQAVENQPEIHHAHRDVTGGWVRPATFGAMDGLVSNFALVAGVIGAGASGQAVLFTGVAGLVAGACSMAVGEFTSVSSQAELTQAEIKTEQRELIANPQEELKELTQVYEAKGLSRALAADVARELSRGSDTAWRVHVREELGIDPDDLPSPWVAAGSSFVAFALGALVPMLPLIVGAPSLMTVAAVSALGLFGSGAVIARLTARPTWFGGGRQLLLGGLTAAVTYGVGMLVGAGLA
jgi:vacuolar iron transporter family protein